MNEHDSTKPQTTSEPAWLLHLEQVAGTAHPVGEAYAEHLARVTPDADCSRALLQANYRALHTAPKQTPGSD